MNSILILGGGLQGKTIAEDLRASLPDRRIEVADVRPGAGTITADLSDSGTMVRLMREHDLVVGALPSKFGFGAMKAAIEARRNLVDLSFCPQDALSLDAEAKRAGIGIVSDCGLAPGLSNLIIGRALAKGPADRARIFVGGFAEDPRRPYGYVVTWSVEDLLEEYTRPARIVTGGKAVEAPVFSGREMIDVPGVGRLEAFLSDGLRTLLALPIREMDEKTLRWPGHIEAIQPLLKAGTLVETIRKSCTMDPPKDLVVLRVDVHRGSRVERTLLVDRFDGRYTAMTRTTALTCSAVAQWAAQGGSLGTGAKALEAFGSDEAFWKHMTGALGRRGVGLGEPRGF